MQVKWANFEVVFFDMSRTKLKLPVSIIDILFSNSKGTTMNSSEVNTRNMDIFESPRHFQSNHMRTSTPLRP